MAITLQVPEVAGVLGSTIRFAHPDISYYSKTTVKTPTTVGGASIAVNDNVNLANGDYILLGSIGNEKTEEININGAVTRGTALTIGNTTKFAHELSAQVTRILERQIQIYGSNNSDGSSPTLIATVSIDWTHPFFTEYTNTGTQYGYYFGKFYDGTTSSTAGTVVASTGLASNSVMKIIEEALYETGAEIGRKEQIGLQYLIEAVNNAQFQILQYVNKMNRVKKGWSFEVVLDDTLQASEYENKYALTGLGVTPKFPDTKQAIVNIRIGSLAPLKFRPIDQFDKGMYGVFRTEVNQTGGVAIGDTSMVLKDVSQLPTSGTLRIGSNTVTYTAKTESTNTISGIPASGTGSVTATITNGASVWQGSQAGLPDYYTIFDGSLFFNRPFSSAYSGWPINIRLYKKLSALTKITDLVEVSFFHIMHLWVSHKICLRLKDLERAGAFKNLFDDELLTNADAEKTHVPDSYTYHNMETGELVHDRGGDNYPNQTAGLDP